MHITLSVNKNNYYCLRFRVHKILIPFFKKSVISKSLATKNKNLAELKATKLYSSYLQILNSISLVTTEQLQELTDAFIDEQLNQNIMSVFAMNSTKYKEVSTTTLTQAYEKYCIWYRGQNITDRQFKMTRNKLKKLILPYFGENIYIEDVTLESINEFKEFLATMPKMNIKRYKYLSFTHIKKLKNIPSTEIINVNTQIGHLNLLKKFFSYMTKANLLKYNPCTLLTMPNNIVSKREPFSKDDISKLVNIFTNLDDRKYIYYTLLYTGMRPSEFWKCKISTSDDGIIYFDLTDKDIKLKTLTSKRTIPLHNKLLDMGIHTKLNSLQSTFKLSTISVYFNITIKPMISDNSNKVMYSFRHTVATTLKRAEVDIDKISELLGHRYTNSTMTKEVYAQGYTLEQLNEAINSLDY